MSLLLDAADLFFIGFSQTSINLCVKMKVPFNGNQHNLYIVLVWYAWPSTCAVITTEKQADSSFHYAWITVEFSKPFCLTVAKSLQFVEGTKRRLSIPKVIFHSIFYTCKKIILYVVNV